MRPAAGRSDADPDVGSRIATAAASLEGERKFVTILFADLHGSMELMADRDPEEARKLLDPVLEHMCDAVEKYGGTVSQVMGDGIMALFGAPTAWEDHAARACHAAFTMQDLVRHYGDQLQRSHAVPVQIRVGLNSGEAVLQVSGHGLHLSYTAIGLSVHVASRMEQMAKPGTILATADTVRLTQGEVEARAIGPVKVKGFDRPVEVAEIARPAVGSPRFRLAAGRAALPFIGRKVELQKLVDTFSEVRAGSEGRLVAVVGEAGIGKSRLVHEFLSSLDEKQVLALDGGGARYGSGAGYRPGLHILRQFFQVADNEDMSALSERVAGKVVALGGGASSVAVPLLFLLRALAPEHRFHTLPVEERRFRVFDALMWLIRRITVDRPLVLAYEDMQWVTSDTFDFLHALSQNLPRSTLVLLSYRPEYDAGWLSKPGCEELRLEGLADEAIRGMASELLGDHSSLAQMKEEFVRRSGGNPLFIEEHVRSMVESGQLVGEPRNYRRGPVTVSFTIPPSIQAVLAARIDRLDREDKHVLQAVAAVGASAGISLLEQVTSVAPDWLAQSLRRLQAAGLLVGRTDGEQLSYAFRHALMQSVAYESLLHGRRRELHRRIMQALAGSEDYDVLARHAVLAEAWEPAIGYLRQAGAMSAAHFADVEAVEYFERAIEIIGRVPPTRQLREIASDLHFQLRNALVPLGRHDRIHAVLRSAEKLARELDDSRRMAHVWSCLSNYYGNVGRSDLALEAAERSLQAAREVGATDVLLGGHLVAGEIHRTLGDYPKARDYLRQTLALMDDEVAHDHLRQVGLPSVRARSHLAWTLAELGDFAEALRVAEEGLRIADGASHRYTLSHACLGLGGTLLRKGEFAAAVPVLTRGLTASERVPLLAPPLAADLGVACSRIGDVAKGLQHLDAAVEGARAMGRLSRLPLILVKCAEIHLLAGEVERAASLGASALSLALEQKERGNEVYARLLLADVYARSEPRPQTAEAEGYYRAAIEKATALSMRPLAARAHAGLGTLLMRGDAATEAREHIAIALAMYGAMGMAFWSERLENAASGAELVYERSG